MYKVKVNNSHDFSFEKKDGTWLNEGKDFAFDMIEVKENSFHIIKDHKSYNAEVVSHNAAEKTFQLFCLSRAGLGVNLSSDLADAARGISVAALGPVDGSCIFSVKEATKYINRGCLIQIS